MTSYKNRIFHPLEISFCGFSGSGKTTLIDKLIQQFAGEFDIGYMKHDAHRFKMDQEGKDTWKASRAGAKMVSISSDTQAAMIYSGDDNYFLERTAFVDMDVVFVEGFKDSLMQKILVLAATAESDAMLEKYRQGELKEVIAVVGCDEISPTNRHPYFQRDDVAGIANFLKSTWQHEINTTPLKALILGGGKSTRMGEDKGALEYFGKTQVAHLQEMLQALDLEVFVSCREEQADLAHLKDYNLVYDKYLGFGPTGGILSAFAHSPQAAWLVVACDMPFVSQASLGELVKKRNPYKLASCFYNETKNWAEPLFSIYEPKAALKFGHYLANDKRCPRKMIRNSNIELIKTNEQKALENINTQTEREVALNQL